MNEYIFPLILLYLVCCTDARIGVPLAAVNCTRDKRSSEDDGEGGQRETWEPVSRRHRLRELSSVMRPSWAGQDGIESCEEVPVAATSRPRGQVVRGGELASSWEQFRSFHREQPGVHCLAESPNQMWKRQNMRGVGRQCPEG